MTRAERETLLVRQLADAQEALNEAADILADSDIRDAAARNAAAVKVGIALGAINLETRLDV